MRPSGRSVAGHRGLHSAVAGFVVFILLFGCSQRVSRDETHVQGRPELVGAQPGALALATGATDWDRTLRAAFALEGLRQFTATDASLLSGMVDRESGDITTDSSKTIYVLDQLVDAWPSLGKLRTRVRLTAPRNRYWSFLDPSKSRRKQSTEECRAELPHADVTETVMAWAGCRHSGKLRQRAENRWIENALEVTSAAEVDALVLHDMIAAQRILASMGPTQLRSQPLGDLCDSLLRGQSNALALRHGTVSLDEWTELAECRGLNVVQESGSREIRSLVHRLRLIIWSSGSIADDLQAGGRAAVYGEAVARSLGAPMSTGSPTLSVGSVDEALESLAFRRHMGTVTTQVSYGDAGEQWLARVIVAGDPAGPDCPDASSVSGVMPQRFKRSLLLQALVARGLTRCRLPFGEWPDAGAVFKSATQRLEDFDTDDRLSEAVDAWDAQQLVDHLVRRAAAKKLPPAVLTSARRYVSALQQPDAWRSAMLSSEVYGAFRLAAFGDGRDIRWWEGVLS